METLPVGALLRDPRNPDLLDIRVVSADARFVLVSIGEDTRRYSRAETSLRRWLLPSRTAVAITPITKHEPKRTGVVIGLKSNSDSIKPWTYLVETKTGTEEI